MFDIADYDYDLPEGLIAQSPAERREQSRLLHLNRTTGAVSHHRFADIAALLDPSDLLVVNDTRVIPARLYGQKATGGKIELLIINYPEPAAAAAGGRRRFECQCLIRASRAPRPGTRLDFGPELEG
ncbi:MAG: S-adenosylmethionine:tRNA ribosyltransferase-isomerase, partial [Thermodesulfobacteriota bacterium]